MAIEEPGAFKPNWISENVPEEVVSQLFRFKIKLPNGNFVHVDMTTSIDFDMETLEEDIVKAPHQYVFWASVYSEAKAMVAIIERAIKIRKGILADAVIESTRRDGIKAPAEKIVTSIIEKDEQLIKLENGLILAQKNTGKLWHMVNAVQMKFDGIRSLAGFKRQEQQVSK